MIIMDNNKLVIPYTNNDVYKKISQQKDSVIKKLFVLSIQ